jgi:hypothetical protein
VYCVAKHGICSPVNAVIWVVILIWHFQTLLLRQPSADVVRSSDFVQDIQVETAEVSNKFKFFETYRAPEKERKRFRITPPREGQVKVWWKFDFFFVVRLFCVYSLDRDSSNFSSRILFVLISCVEFLFFCLSLKGGTTLMTNHQSWLSHETEACCFAHSAVPQWHGWGFRSRVMRYRGAG